MAYIVRMPKLGMEMDEGTLLEWHVGEGEDVTEGELIAEVESEKSVGEVEAREDGVLREVFIGEGDTVEPSVAIGIVAGPDEDIADLREETGGGDGTTADEPSEPTAESSTEDTTATEDSTDSEPASSEDVRASPRAKARAEDLGVDLTTVEGSGPGGAITADDVEEAETGGEPESETASIEPTVREETAFDGMRQTIADRLSESYRNAVHVTEHREIDAEEFLTAVEAANGALEADIAVPDLLVLALSATLSEHPGFNATFEDGVHRSYKDHNVCIAVDIEEGLIAPALRNVESKSLEGIATDRRDLTERALDGEYTMDDLQGGTFTVTNLGVLGVESFDPVINPPQVAILGVNAITERATRADSGVEFRRQLPLDLSFDHRVVDGADAARFLETLAGHIENPWPLVL